MTKNDLEWFIIPLIYYLRDKKGWWNVQVWPTDRLTGERAVRQTKRCVESRVCDLKKSLNGTVCCLLYRRICLSSGYSFVIFHCISFSFICRVHWCSFTLFCHSVCIMWSIPKCLWFTLQCLLLKASLCFYEKSWPTILVVLFPWKSLQHVLFYRFVSRHWQSRF